jgi:hypothetical protein
VEKASKPLLMQAATAPPPVGPTNPSKSIVEMFKPSENRPIRTAEDLDAYMRTGNRPTIEWMQQARDRTIENYVDHQRPFLACCAAMRSIGRGQSWNSSQPTWRARIAPARPRADRARGGEVRHDRGIPRPPRSMLAAVHPAAHPEANAVLRQKLVKGRRVSRRS